MEEAKLTSALSTNYNAVKSLFINQGTVTGMAQRINVAVDALDDVENGSFTIRKNSLGKQINDLANDIDRKETRYPSTKNVFGPNSRLLMPSCGGCKVKPALFSRARTPQGTPWS